MIDIVGIAICVLILAFFGRAFVQEVREQRACKDRIKKKKAETTPPDGLTWGDVADIITAASTDMERETLARCLPNGQLHFMVREREPVSTCFSLYPKMPSGGDQ